MQIVKVVEPGATGCYIGVIITEDELSRLLAGSVIDCEGTGDIQDALDATAMMLSLRYGLLINIRAMRVLHESSWLADNLVLGSMLVDGNTLPIVLTNATIPIARTTWVSMAGKSYGLRIVANEDKCQEIMLAARDPVGALVVKGDVFPLTELN